MKCALDFLLLALVHGSAVASIAWGLERMLRKRISPALYCALWTIVLAKFFLPAGPAVTFALSPAFSPVSSVLAPIALRGRTGAAPTNSPWPPILFAIYLLAVAALAAYRIITARRLVRSVDALPAAPPALLAAVRNAALKLGLRRLPAVRIGAGLFIFGCWRPTLVVPFERGESAEARAMLLHELAHLRRGDPWVRALQNLAQIVFFFWPPVRWVNRKIEEHRELACDQLALEHGALSPAAYARVLLEAERVATGRPLGFAVLEMSSHGSRLERRIDMLLDLDRRRSPKWAALLLISGAALALSGTALAVDGGSAGVTGRVDEAPIKNVVREHRADVRACYDAPLASSPALEGRLVFDWTITPTGAVGEGCVTSSDFSPKLSPEREAELWGCVNGVVRGLRFPARADVSYPFVFKLVGHPPVLEAE